MFYLRSVTPIIGQLLALVELPPFGMGVTRANFQQSGEIPVRNDKLIR